jgi:type IV pilus assembly protein PilA
MIEKRKDSGFTLVELMIVIAVIGILAVVIVPKVGMVRTQAKLSGIDVNMRMVQAYVQSTISNQTKTDQFCKDLAAAFPVGATGDDALINPLTGTVGTVEWDKHGGALEYVNKTYADKAETDKFITGNSSNAIQGEIVITFFTDPNNSDKFDVVLYPHDQNGSVITNKVMVVTP